MDYYYTKHITLCPNQRQHTTLYRTITHLLVVPDTLFIFREDCAPCHATSIKNAYFGSQLLVYYIYYRSDPGI